MYKSFLSLSVYVQINTCVGFIFSFFVCVHIYLCFDYRNEKLKSVEVLNTKLLNKLW